MALTDKNLTLREVQELLSLNGIDWSYVWIKTQVACGRIPSEKIYHSRVVPRHEVEKIISKKKAAIR